MTRNTVTHKVVTRNTVTRTSLISLIVLPMLWACGTTQEALPPTSETAVAPVYHPDKSPFSQVLETNFRGQLVAGDNQAWFTPCGFERGFVIAPNPEFMSIYNQIAPRPFEPVYVEFAGEIVPSANMETSTIRLDRVHHMAVSKLSAQCAKEVEGFHFKAAGIDPYWQTKVQGQTMSFGTQTSSQSYKVNLSQFKTTQRNTIRAVSDNGFMLLLNIRPGHCYSDNGSVYWGYQASADAAWGRYQGCGEPGWPAVDKSIPGNYMGNSVKDDGITLDLVLHADYSATLITQSSSITLSGKHQSQPRKETGFWKSNDPTEVNVFLTQQGEKEIAKELIFDRKGLGLTARSINVAGELTRYTGQELLLDKMTGGPEMVVSRQPQPKARTFTPAKINPTGRPDTQLTQAVADYFRYHRTNPGNTKFTGIKYDLNGDGIDDALVQLSWCSHKGCVLLVFAGTENGYEFISRTENVASPLLMSRMKNHKWQSLFTQLDGSWRQLYYNGVSYPANASKEKQWSAPAELTAVEFFTQGRPTRWYSIPRS